MIGIGLVGCGYWGQKLLRAFARTPDCRIVAVCDLRTAALQTARELLPQAETTTDGDALLRDGRIDAVVVATPVPSHAPLTIAALAAGKDVLVEKPMAASLDEARRMVEEVERRRRVLMVDHTFLYTEAVHALRELIASDAGELTSYDATRANCGPRRVDADVVWDLAVHDLSIIDLVLPPPQAVRATGTRRAPGTLADAASLQLWFDGPLTARLEVDWLAAEKVRRTCVEGRRGAIVYDDLEPHAKLRIHDRADGTRVPALELSEPLRAVAAHFVDCVASRRRPATDATAGLRIVQWLDAASRSMHAGGTPIALASAAV